MEFDEMLRAHGVPALDGVDTRRLAVHIREHGAQKAYIHCSGESVSEAEAVRRANAWEGLDGRDMARAAARAEAFEWNPERTAGPLAVVVDCGAPYGFLRALDSAGLRVHVEPCGAGAQAVLAHEPDAVVFSDGPGDPAGAQSALALAKALAGKSPLYGFGLGCQIIALSCGAAAPRSARGRFGCGRPVKDLRSGAVSLATRNSIFTLAADALPKALEITHESLDDGAPAGFRHKKLPITCLQHQPAPAEIRALFAGLA